MGGYAFFVWLAVAMTVAPLALLALHTVLQRRAILRGVAWRSSRRARRGCVPHRRNRRRREPAT